MSSSGNPDSAKESSPEEKVSENDQMKAAQPVDADSTVDDALEPDNRLENLEKELDDAQNRIVRILAESDNMD